MAEVAAGLPADMVFLDMEDAVAPSEKGTPAREAAVAALRAHAFRAPTVGVRVNPVGTPWCHGDLAHLVAHAGDRIDVVLLPKVDDPGQVHFADHLLSGLEAEAGLPPRGIGLEVQIEGARALVDADAIAAACPARVEALVLGPGDMAASLGMPQTSIGAPAAGYPGDVWHHILARIVVAARANGLQAIDGPWADLSDPGGLRASAARARALGVDGKWSIHPSQIAVLNEEFGVSADELARAEALLAAFAAATEAGHGAALHEGEMIDEATRRMAAGIVARAGRAAPGR